MPAANVSYQRTREMTIDELLLENRIVFLIGDINHASAARVMMQMLYLENQRRGQDISLYINSPGGENRRRLGEWFIKAGIIEADRLQALITEARAAGCGP